jgi:hypothetical protein
MSGYMSWTAIWLLPGLGAQCSHVFGCSFHFGLARTLWMCKGNCRKTEGKMPLGRPRRRWKDNIEVDLEEMLWIDVNWIHVYQDGVQWRALVITVMIHLIP